MLRVRQGWEGNDLLKTIISHVNNSEWKPSNELYYLVNDGKNRKLYAKYKRLPMRRRKSSLVGSWQSISSIMIWIRW